MNVLFCSACQAVRKKISDSFVERLFVRQIVFSGHHLAAMVLCVYVYVYVRVCLCVCLRVHTHMYQHIIHGISSDALTVMDMVCLVGIGGLHFMGIVGDHSSLAQVGVAH